MVRNVSCFDGELSVFWSTPTCGLPTRFKSVGQARRCSFVTMDAADPEARMRGLGAISREERGQSKLTLLLLVTHSVLICACATCCCYIWNRLNDGSQSQPPLYGDNGIYLNLLKDKHQGDTLNFTVTWNNSLELEHGSEVKVQYPGPYIFYICAVVCCNGAKGSLNLTQGHTITSIELLATPEKKCTRHQRLVSLYEAEIVRFSFSKQRTDVFLKDLRVGLHYILGSKYFLTPDER